MTNPDSPLPTGRSPQWRLATAAAGFALLAAGVALFVWPWVLAWVAAAAFGALGCLLVASALLARGRG